MFVNQFVSNGSASSQEVKAYLLRQCGMSEKRAEQTVMKFSAHPDILEEFACYIRNGGFPAENQLQVEEFTAEQLNRSTHLSVVGAYNYLIFLRDSPTEALDSLKKGLPRK